MMARVVLMVCASYCYCFDSRIALASLRVVLFVWLFGMSWDNSIYHSRSGKADSANA